MLADLNLRELPDEALSALRDAISGELQRRKSLKELERRQPLMAQWHAAKTAGTLPEMWSIPASFPLAALQGTYKDRLFFLPRLLAQDWSSIFPVKETTSTEYYVYIHYDPRSKPIELKPMKLLLQGKPFYIGKGSGTRAWDLRRNQGHGKRIAYLRQFGYGDEDMVQIICEHLTEHEALSLEAKLIYFFGSIYEEQTDGCLVNLADHARPRFQTEMDDWQGRPQKVLPGKSVKATIMILERRIARIARLMNEHFS